MIVESYSRKKGQQILIGMIVSSRVLSRISSKWTKEGLFSSPWENIIAKWCIAYYLKYSKAPGKHIENLFASWAAEHDEKENIKLIESFLSGLSRKYADHKKKINPDYIVDQAGEYFNEIAVRNFNKRLEGDIASGKITNALTRINKFSRIEIGREELVKLNNKNLWDDVFAEPPEPLIKYPGDLGKFFGRSMRRDRFVVFMGPMKRGKSFWTFDAAWRAMEQQRKTLYFQLGDLSREEEMERVAARIANKPTFAGEYYMPKGKIDVQDNLASIERIKKTSKYGLGPKEVKEAIKRLTNNKARLENKVDLDYLQFSFHPTRSLGMDGLRNIVDLLISQDWVPDVVVLDYMDILCPPAGFAEDHRAGVNDNWMNCRRLSQELKGLLISSTQASAKSFKADNLGMEHFAEDNRKFAHVTGMVGLNQKTEEKEKEIWRLNWVVLRGEKFSQARPCYSAGSLAVSNPAICSYFADW